LRALEDSPGAFTSTIERETAFGEQVWRARTANAAIAGTGAAAIGLVSGIVHEGNMHVAGMWVAPEARGSGAGRALLDWVIEKARAEGYDVVTLDFIEGNAAAQRLYSGAGFRATGPAVPVSTDPTRRQIAMTLAIRNRTA
jgi:ribosomal protein S18 acetylase RimI-like enzyme